MSRPSLWTRPLFLRPQPIASTSKLPPPQPHPRLHLHRRSYAIRPVPYNPNFRPSTSSLNTATPTIDPLLPPGFTFYANHNNYPMTPVPDPTKMYQSDVFPPQLPRTTVFHYLFPPRRKGQHFRYYPELDPRTIAFIDGITGKELYRTEMAVRAMWLASGLGGLRLKKGDVVCIFGMNSLHWVEAMMGCQANGNIVSPANYGYSPEELLHQLTDSTAKAIFVQPELVPTLEKALSIDPKKCSIDPKRIILLCDFEQKPADTPYSSIQEIWSKQKIPKQATGSAEKETAYLCYSSGTTGRAKGVETSHHNITSQIQAINKSYEPLGINDRILGILPFGHIYGLTFLCHQPLTTGTPVIVLPKFDLEQVFKTIQNYRITWALVVPPMLIAMLNSPFWDKYDVTSLKGVQTGAAPCSAELIDAFEAKFPKIKVQTGWGKPEIHRPSCLVTQGYGLTETSPMTHVMTAVEGSQHRGKIGKIVTTMQARLVDDQGKDVEEEGERGELWLRGPSVMKGYWRNPEATANTFAPGGWFKTGDVATVDKDGYFAIVDRVKELIKYKGYQVPPAELEMLLIQHSKLADAGVIGLYDESQATELPRAYVVPKGGVSSIPEDQRAKFCTEIQDWVADKVSNAKRLRGGVVLVDVVPKSPSGKILRKILREQAKEEVKAGVQKGREAKL